MGLGGCMRVHKSRSMGWGGAGQEGQARGTVYVRKCPGVCNAAQGGYMGVSECKCRRLGTGTWVEEIYPSFPRKGCKS